MKITVHQKTLADAVLNIQRAVSTKSTIPALEGILLKAGNNELTLNGYNLELGMTTTLPASVEEPGSIILSARLFSDIVRRMPGEQLTITVDNRQVAQIVCGASSFSIIGIPAEEFPEFPAVSQTTSFKMEHKVLKSMIRQTIFAISQSDAKPVHTGSLFELEDGVLHVVSVDGYRLAMRCENVNFDGSLSFVVPDKTLSEVLKLLSDDDSEVTICVGPRHILFTIHGYTVLSNLLEGEFLDYRAAIPRDSSTVIKMRTRDLMDSVERVSLLITDRVKSPVRSVFEENSVKLSCSTAMGRAADQSPCTMEGSPVEMGFNNRYLLDALHNAEDDEIRIELRGPLSPMKILPLQGESYLFLVLPVRLKNEG